MSFMKDPKRSKFDVEPGLASPLDVAAGTAERETLAMVAEALKLRRTRLAFQPAVYAADPSIIGFYEGFIRLLDSRDRVIPAREFMGVTERQELGREIDCAALQMGLMTLQRNPGVRVAVNMSARSVGYKRWTALLRQALKQAPELGACLILEINEASAMQVPDVLLPFMAEMREAGIVFSLDDFGAAGTSLGLLRDFQFEIAKIDGMFIRHIDSNAENQPVVRSAIAIARELGMFLVAEAVETDAEANWLRDAGVGCLQGYLFGAPTVTPDFAAFRKGRTKV
ncbi:EAL domain-containing protein [Tabrizicola sp. BL-A-41-H6]|uniref:EAL domain-containing protein n=1 Tax=Tabrizicola sp. BL-A-41-H6 TaxID=3421107 RepID=UPI003D675EB5